MLGNTLRILEFDVNEIDIEGLGLGHVFWVDDIHQQVQNLNDLDENLGKETVVGVLLEIYFAIGFAKFWIIDGVDAAKEETHIVGDNFLLQFTVTETFYHPIYYYFFFYLFLFN